MRESRFCLRRIGAAESLSSWLPWTKWTRIFYLCPSGPSECRILALTLPFYLADSFFYRHSPHSLSPAQSIAFYAICALILETTSSDGDSFSTDRQPARTSRLRQRNPLRSVSTSTWGLPTDRASPGTRREALWALFLSTRSSTPAFHSDLGDRPKPNPVLWFPRRAVPKDTARRGPAIEVRRGLIGCPRMHARLPWEPPHTRRKTRRRSSPARGHRPRAQRQRYCCGWPGRRECAYPYRGNALHFQLPRERRPRWDSADRRPGCERAAGSVPRAAARGRPV